MYTIIKMTTVLENGTVLNEYVSQVEIENGLAVWVKASANEQEAIQFDTIDRVKLNAVVDLLLDGMNIPDTLHSHITFA